MYHTIYQTTNNIDGKIYIGKHSSSTLDNNYYGSGTHLRNAIRKYGKQNFTKEILMILTTEESAYLWEGIIVDVSFIRRDDTYNMKCGGRGGMYGHIWSDESKSKSSRAKKGIPKPIGFGDRISTINTGKTLSDECKAKLSLLNMGKKQSAETIYKKSLAITGQTRSDETRKKMSKSTKFTCQPILVSTIDHHGLVIGEERFDTIVAFRISYNIPKQVFTRRRKRNPTDLTFKHNDNTLSIVYL